MPVADPMSPARLPEDRPRLAVDMNVSQRHREIQAPEGKEAPAAQLIAAEAVESLERAAETIGRRVDVQYRQEDDVVVMTVYREDPESGEEVVVRETPPEEALRLARRLEQLRSTIFDEIA